MWGLRGMEKETSLRSKSEMGGSQGEGGEERMDVGHYRMKRNHCRADESEILIQAVGSAGYFNFKDGDAKG